MPMATNDFALSLTNLAGRRLRAINCTILPFSSSAVMSVYYLSFSIHHFCRILTIVSSGEMMVSWKVNCMVPDYPSLAPLYSFLIRFQPSLDAIAE